MGARHVLAIRLDAFVVVLLQGRENLSEWEIAVYAPFDDREAILPSPEFWNFIIRSIRLLNSGSKLLVLVGIGVYAVGKRRRLNVTRFRSISMRSISSQTPAIENLSVPLKKGQSHDLFDIPPQITLTSTKPKAAGGHHESLFGREKEEGFLYSSLTTTTSQTRTRH
jgi:hypothetical protein